jgi:hypothetical protein
VRTNRAPPLSPKAVARSVGSRWCVDPLRQERLKAGASTNAPQVAWFVRSRSMGEPPRVQGGRVAPAAFHGRVPPRPRFLSRQPRRGLPGVYNAVISGHRESPPVQRIRRNEAPEATGGDSSRQWPITRNEGVPGSSPGVGFRFAGIFRSDRGLSEGVEGSTRGPPNEVLRVKPLILQVFFLTADRRKVIRGLSSPVTQSHLQSRLTPKAVVK